MYRPMNKWNHHIAKLQKLPTKGRKHFTQFGICWNECSSNKYSISSYFILLRNSVSQKNTGIGIGGIQIFNIEFVIKLNRF